MATWKKVIVSGSSAELSNLRVSGLTSLNQPNIVSYDTASGQFYYQGTGSFTATTASYILSSGVDGPLGMNSIASASQALTASLALRTTGSLIGGTGLSQFTFSGSNNVTVSVSGAAQLTNNILTKWDSAAGKFVNSSLTDTGTVVTGSSSIALTGANSSLTGSFTGSFSGFFSGSTNLPDLTGSTGITAFTYDGSTPAQVSVSGAANLVANNITKWTGTAFAPSSLHDNGTVVTGSVSIQLTGTNSSLTGSFTGSFRGDGSQLTGLATTLRVSGSGASNTGSLNLLTQALTITGSATGISASVASGSAGVTVNLGLSPNLRVTNLTVDNNLTVLGTASFQNTTNLEVSDRFILLASGSNTTGDGGLVVQQATQNVGELFGYDSGAQRWALTGSFTANQSAFTPDAFMAAVVEGTSGNPSSAPGRYVAKGNLFIGNDETIWIYS
jgi:hypothetical protein